MPKLVEKNGKCWIEREGTEGRKCEGFENRAFECMKANEGQDYSCGGLMSFVKDGKCQPDGDVSKEILLGDLDFDFINKNKTKFCGGTIKMKLGDVGIKCTSQSQDLTYDAFKEKWASNYKSEGKFSDNFCDNKGTLLFGDVNICKRFVSDDKDALKEVKLSVPLAFAKCDTWQKYQESAAPSDKPAWG